jgi:hypothetical protein
MHFLIFMQVTVDGVTVDFQVSPILAAILSHFEDQEEFGAAELAERVSVTEGMLKE